MRADVVELTRELVARESENPPGREREVAEYLEGRLESSPVPFEVETEEVEPDRPNVVARVGDPSHGSVLLTGHLDVVPANAPDWTGDPYTLRERSGRIVGRGTADMKSALAAKLVATEKYYAEVDAPGEVVLGLVVDEEVDGAGTQALVESGLRSDVAIIGEPTDLRVCVAQKGVVRYEVTVTGESGHAGRPDDADNAIPKLRHVLERLDDLDDRVRESSTHELLEPETVTVTEIEGGIAPNVVPDRASATIDWRFHPDTDPADLDRALRDVLEDPSIDGDPVSVQLNRTVLALGGEIPVDHELARVVSEAASAADAPGDIVGFEAATDARFLLDAGIPTVLFGPGSIERDAHTVDESISVDDLETTAETYRESLHRLLS